MWNERYQTDDFVYGKKPNDFLRQVSARLPSGKTLCLAEGEGRNAVFLAQHGHDVTAVDSSYIGLTKAQRLAVENSVQIKAEVADLAEYVIGEESWDAIVSIFCHVPPPLRKSLHRKIVLGLRPGGTFILEAYTPAQLNFDTGGPPVREMMMTLSELKTELAGLDLEHALETERVVIEGSLHTGRGSVVQIVARKPAAKLKS